jgi:hypothetical protein
MPKSSEKNKERQNSNTAENKKPDTTPMTKRNFNLARFLRTYHGVGTAFFTAILVFFTYLLYKVSDAANDTNRATQRAIVTFSGMGLGPRLTNDKGEWAGQEFQLSWSNTGTTPAKAVVMQSNGREEIGDLPSSYDFPLNPQKTQGVIGPKGVFGVNLTISRNTLESAWHSKSKLFIWGNAAYRDIFPDDIDRLSEFCIEINKITVGYIVEPEVPKGQKPPPPVIEDPNVGIVQFSWQACTLGAHNCYDEDCKDYKESITDMRKK